LVGWSVKLFIDVLQTFFLGKGIYLMEENLLEIKNLSKSFAKNKVLSGINISVGRGSVLGLMGENGAGKSTMMKCLFGIYSKDEGQIFLEGKPIDFSSPKEALENGVAMVHQELNQCLDRSVTDNLFLGRYPVRMGIIDEKKMFREVTKLFASLNMSVNPNTIMRTMSVSQRQMVEIAKAVEILNKAERPVIYAGFGGVKAGEVITELSRKIKAPIITTGKNFEAFEWNYEGLTGSAYRVGWKPANEVVFEADTVLFLGSNFPFAEVYQAFKNTEKFIQVDIDPYKLGKRHALDASILGDAGQAAKAILDKVNPVESTPWWRANVKNNQNWRDYMNKIEGKTEGELQLYQVYNAINKHADQDAIYSIDVGDTTQTSTRHLHMTPKNMWRTSPLFATMGIALPGGIAAKKDNPDRQVWNIMGDGAFNMCYPDVITNVQYDLPVINVVFSNGKYAFIKDKYEDTNKHLFGCDFPNADYAKIAEAQGAVGFTVDRIEDIDAVVAEAVKLNKEGKTVVIDARITPHRPLPVEVLELDPKLHSEEAIKDFKEKYEAEELVPFRLFLEEEGLQSRAIK